ncbi:hypothetical protein EII17_01705 [Clostridiales bacterium COT073_COT-073]|nr:hypothetical protein EII17_01705 [Clostridiales bacterium COT073_COT-073]
MEIHQRSEINLTTDYFQFYVNLYQYILKRLWLESEVTEQNLLQLCQLSLHRQSQGISLTEEQLLNSVSKTDCRGTNSIVKKKVLLIMHLEKKLNVRLDDVASTEIDTVEELAAALYRLCGKK